MRDREFADVLVSVVTISLCSVCIYKSMKICVS